MAYAEAADPEDAAVQLRALTAEEPLNESAHARLMLVLAASGRQAAALGVFEEVRRRLDGELGIEPGPELRAAQRQVLRAGLRRPGTAGPRARPATRGRRRLPRPHRPAGRAGRARWTGDGTGARIAVLSGTGGVGKTALAVHWAQRSLAEFPDGQLYLDLHGYGTVRPVEPGDALSGFLRALGVDGADIPAEPEERAAKFRTALTGRRMVLLLDNAGSVGQVRPLLPGSPSCLVLVTSRDALPGLVARHGARRVLVDLLTEAEALDLLRALLGERVDERAGRHRGADRVLGPAAAGAAAGRGAGAEPAGGAARGAGTRAGRRTTAAGPARRRRRPADRGPRRLLVVLPAPGARRRARVPALRPAPGPRPDRRPRSPRSPASRCRRRSG